MTQTDGIAVVDDTAAFRLAQVQVDYGRQRALGPVDAAFGWGTSVALMGPNGSGKTTLLRLLAGLIEPTTGELDATGANVSIVAQNQEQHQWMPITVGEVVLLGRYQRLGLLGRVRASDRAAVANAMDRMHVGDLVHRRFGDLSGGQRQRALVASALASDSPTLLLDEPITGLDIPSQQLILDVISDEARAGRLVVVSTHHLDEARHCDRVLLLNTAVIADGAPSDVLVRPNLERTFGASAVSDGPGGLGLVDHHGHGTHDHDHDLDPALPIDITTSTPGGHRP